MNKKIVLLALLALMPCYSKTEMSNLQRFLWTTAFATTAAASSFAQYKLDFWGKLKERVSSLQQSTQPAVQPTTFIVEETSSSSSSAPTPTRHITEQEQTFFASLQQKLQADGSIFFDAQYGAQRYGFNAWFRSQQEYIQMLLLHHTINSSTRSLLTAADRYHYFQRSNQTCSFKPSPVEIYTIYVDTVASLDVARQLQGHQLADGAPLVVNIILEQPEPNRRSMIEQVLLSSNEHTPMRTISEGMTAINPRYSLELYTGQQLTVTAEQLSSTSTAPATRTGSPTCPTSGQSTIATQTGSTMMTPYGLVAAPLGQR